MGELPGTRWSEPGAFNNIADYDLVETYRFYILNSEVTTRETQKSQSTDSYYGHASNLAQALEQIEVNQKALRAFEKEATERKILLSESVARLDEYYDHKQNGENPTRPQIAYDEADTYR